MHIHTNLKKMAWHFLETSTVESPWPKLENMLQIRLKSIWLHVK